MITAPRPSATAMLWAFAGGCLVAGLVLLFYPEQGGAPLTQESEEPATSSAPTEPATSPSTPPQPAAQEETEDSARPETAAEPALMHQDEAALPFTPAAWDLAAEQAALSAGLTFMQAWLSTAPVEEWWPELEPLMNVNGAAIYALVDPELIVPADITGDPRLSSTPSPYYVEISVPTTAGDYVVSLTRDAQGAGWLTERLLQPEPAPEPGAGA